MRGCAKRTASVRRTRTIDCRNGQRPSGRSSIPRSSATIVDIIPEGPYETCGVVALDPDGLGRGPSVARWSSTRRWPAGGRRSSMAQDAPMVRQSPPQPLAASPAAAPARTTRPRRMAAWSAISTTRSSSRRCAFASRSACGATPRPGRVLLRQVRLLQGSAKFHGPRSCAVLRSDAPGPGPDVLDDLDFRQLTCRGRVRRLPPVLRCSARFPCGGYNLSTLPIGPRQSAGRIWRPRRVRRYPSRREGGPRRLARATPLTVPIPGGSFSDGAARAKALARTTRVSSPRCSISRSSQTPRTAWPSNPSSAFWLPTGGSDGVPTRDRRQLFTGNVLFLRHRSELSSSTTATACGLRPSSSSSAGESSVGSKRRRHPELDASGTNIVNLKFGADLNFQDPRLTLCRLRACTDRRSGTTTSFALELPVAAAAARAARRACRARRSRRARAPGSGRRCGSSRAGAR